MKSLKLSEAFAPITGALMRYHAVLFVVLALGGLSVYIYFLYGAIAPNIVRPEPQSVTSQPFDRATIERLESLNQKSGDGKPLAFPNNQRINPFSE